MNFLYLLLALNFVYWLFNEDTSQWRVTVKHETDTRN